MDHPPIKDNCLILPTGPVPIPPGLLTSKAFTKSGVIDGRSHAGKALRGWVQEQIAATMPLEAPQPPQDSQFAPEGVDHPSEAEAAPAGSVAPSGDMVSEYRQSPLPRVTPDTPNTISGAVETFGLPGGHTETPAPAATTPADHNPQPQPAPLPFGDMPRLGSHESAKRLVEIIIELYPDAKPLDWRSCQAMLANAQRYGSLWSQKTRK